VLWSNELRTEKIRRSFLVNLEWRSDWRGSFTWKTLLRRENTNVYRKNIRGKWREMVVTVWVWES